MLMETVINIQGGLTCNWISFIFTERGAGRERESTNIVQMRDRYVTQHFAPVGCREHKKL